MKRLAVVSILAFLFFVAANTERAANPLAVMVTIAPTENDPIQLLGPRSIPGAYRCRAVVTDALDQRYVFAVPEVVVSPGHREMKTVKQDDLSVEFTVAVSKANDRAMTKVIAKRADKIVLQQQSDVFLRAQKKTIVPLR